MNVVLSVCLVVISVLVLGLDIFILIMFVLLLLFDSCVIWNWVVGNCLMKIWWVWVDVLIVVLKFVVLMIINVLVGFGLVGFSDR